MVTTRHSLLFLCCLGFIWQIEAADRPKTDYIEIIVKSLIGATITIALNRLLSNPPQESTLTSNDTQNELNLVNAFNERAKTDNYTTVILNNQWERFCPQNSPYHDPALCESIKHALNQHFLEMNKRYTIIITKDLS